MATIIAARLDCTGKGLEVWCAEHPGRVTFWRGVLRQADLDLAKLNAVLAAFSADDEAAANTVNQDFGSHLRDKWREVRGTIFKWIMVHPAATALQAKTAFDTAYPGSPFNAVELFALLQDRFGFADWAALRDYIVAHAASIREEVG